MTSFFFGGKDKADKASLWEAVRLTLRLLKDPRVPFWVKAIPILAVLYWLAPDPIPTPLDDMTFFLMALGLFVYLAPKHVVDEHRRHLKG
ncbi:MAG: hypothetical protein GXO36_07355, partial [Chloroflexi bacterium]|nr:hypothetical protein [Chloroflexota bacterium]